MKQFDFYNPISHEGDLPVRVLSFNYLDWFKNITPDFKDDFKSEAEFNGLNEQIKYNTNRSKITDCALINPRKQIELFENYNQYLWCVCYSLFVLFDETIQKPMIAGMYNGKIDFDNPYARQALEVFNNGFDLIKNFKDWQFFQLPNPEKYNEYDQFYVERTNGVFTAAMTFVLLHEFAHQYFGHLDYIPANKEEAKHDEYTADEYAIDKMSYNFTSKAGKTLKFGIVAGLSSLIIIDKSLDGGDKHPDADDRLRSAMNKLDLEELDNLWGIASLTFRLWAIKHKIEINLPDTVDSYKVLFDLMLDAVKPHR